MNAAFSGFSLASRLLQKSGVVFDLAFDFDLRAPLTTMAVPECGHAEPRRSTEWWGKDLLVTFDWAGIPGVCQK